MTTDGTTAPGAHRARRVLRAVASVVLYAAALGAAWVLWPSTLGGCTTLTIVSGHSMEPTYQTGDLVVSRCGTPEVGDVVVYAPDALDGGRVIHRVVGGDATGGWVVRGDNNDWTDPFAPTGDEILGVAQVHVAKVGLVGKFVASPWVFGSCLLIALALFVWPPRREDDAAAPADVPLDDALPAGDAGDGAADPRDAEPTGPAPALASTRG